MKRALIVAGLVAAGVALGLLSTILGMFYGGGAW